MIKKTNYKIILLLLLVIVTSCNKWLDLKPQDGIIKQNFWKSKEDVKSAVIGCYSSLLGQTALTLFLWGELRADMIAATIRASNEQVEIMNGNILSSNSITSWRVIYKTINYCNTVIDFAPGVLKNDKTLSEAELNAYLSEAYALRALMYLDLLKTFGDVPLKLAATSSDEDLVQLPVSSKEDVFKQILSDLAFAETHAVLTYGDRNMDKGRITKYTVFAIQADANLWMEKYAECISACDKVINSKQFGLIVGNDQWFSTVFANGNSNESIFEFQFDNQALNPFYNVFISGSKQFTGAPTVMDEVYTIDLTNDLNKDIRGDLASIRASDGSIWKFAGADNTGTLRTATSCNAHWFVYRYADILLMKSEALAWTGKGQEALDLVKVIRDRANALVATEKAPDPTSSIEVTDYIMEERAREFAFEGKRWFDIIRNAKRNNYAHIQFMLDIVAKSAPSDKQQSIINKAKDYRSHYLPINLYELQTDKNLVQNSFYQ